MVIPNIEPEDEAEEVIEEVEAVVEEKPTSTSKYDFEQDGGNPANKMVYTVSTRMPEGWKTLTIVATNYGKACELAGILRDQTIKTDQVPFFEEG